MKRMDFRLKSAMASLPLSVLDLSPISAGQGDARAVRETVDLAQCTERLGYNRYWVAEHHNIPSVASTAPEIMIGQIAARTSRMRIGSGGIMLPNHAPLRIAEAFHVLEALYPKRIDLGIGRAPGTDQLTALALRRSRERLGAADFPAQLAELIGLSTGDLPASHPFAGIRVIPSDVALPPVWVLGSTEDGASIAATFGLGFAFAHHINPGGALEALDVYRSSFRASHWLDRPRTILTAQAICGETDVEAEYLTSTFELAWVRLRSGRPAPLSPPEEASAYMYSAGEQDILKYARLHCFTGGPGTLREKLLDHVNRAGADELMIITTIYGHAQRMHSYELIAKSWPLPESSHDSI
jgi:luciferase family oxidoreductase group 1